MRRVLGMASAAVGLLVLTSQSVLAQAITSVPDNAVLMVKVNNLEQTSKKLGALFQQWGIAAMNPAMGDPLVAFEGMSNIQQGVNRAGEGALVVVNPMQAGQQRGAPVVIMLPVSDYDAFIKNFPDAQADGELTMITMPMSQDTGYVAKWGSFAAISQNRSLVAKRPQATKIAGLAAKEMQGRDIIAYINVAGFRNQVAGLMSLGRAGMIGQIDQQLQQKPEQAKYAPVAIAAANQAFNGIDHVLAEAQAMTIGVDLSAAGVQVVYMADFMPDSYLGKLVSGWKAPQEKLISGLPDGKYVMAGGIALDSNTAVQLMDDVTGPIVTEAQALGDEAKPLVGYLGAIKQMLQATSSESIGLGAGQGQPGKSPLFEIVASYRGDADKLVAGQRDMVKYQDQFSKVLQMPGQPKTTTQIVPAAKTVGGISFDQLTTKVEGVNPNDPGQKILDLVYGEGGMSVLSGKVDPKTLLLTTSKADAQIQTAIAAAKAGTDPVANNAQVKEVSAKLPQNAFVVGYMFPDQMLELASKASQAFTGNAIQTKLPENLQPIAFSVNTDGSAVLINGYVPSAVVQSAISIGMQQAIREQQQQQKQPGGGL